MFYTRTSQSQNLICSDLFVYNTSVQWHWVWAYYIWIAITWNLQPCLVMQHLSRTTQGHINSRSSWKVQACIKTPPAAGYFWCSTRPTLSGNYFRCVKSACGGVCSTVFARPWRQTDFTAWRPTVCVTSVWQLIFKESTKCRTGTSKDGKHGVGESTQLVKHRI